MKKKKISEQLSNIENLNNYTILQVLQNFKSYLKELGVHIEDLENNLVKIFYAKVNLEPMVSSVALSDTDITDSENYQDILISTNGNVFKIVTITDDTVYIKYGFTLPAGPQGKQGLQGPKGDQGLTGEKGEQGPTGPQGATGPRGMQGPAGPQGPIGLTGSQGPKGEQGPAGVQGLQGPKGDKGDSGNDFTIQGYVTNTGALPQNYTEADIGKAYLVGTETPRRVYLWGKNELGALVWSDQGYLQGPAGPQGPQGVQGLQGEQGLQGATGPQGPQGLQGPAGDQGPAGNDGAEGPAGPQGEAGPAGPAGPTGAKGRGISDIKIDPNTQTQAGIYYHVNVEYDDGSTQFAGDILCPEGPTGPKGDTGPQGPQGEPGFLNEVYRIYTLKGVAGENTGIPNLSSYKFITIALITKDNAYVVPVTFPTSFWTTSSKIEPEGDLAWGPNTQFYINGSSATTNRWALIRWSNDNFYVVNVNEISEIRIWIYN